MSAADQAELRTAALDALRASGIDTPKRPACRGRRTDGPPDSPKSLLARTFACCRSNIETELGPEHRNLGYWVFRTLELRIIMHDEHKVLSDVAYEESRAVDRSIGYK